MDNFSELIKNAIAEGDNLESAMRKAAIIMAKESVESLLKSELTAMLGYDKYESDGKNSGDSRNGSYERTVQTSLGPLTISVPRDRNALVKRKWTQAERLLVTSPIYSVQWLEVLISSIVPCIGQELGNRVQTRASPC